jgi:hypothetical protein
MMKFIGRILLLLILLLVVAGFWAWKAVTADEPRDLGVASGPEDLASAQEKLGQEFVAVQLGENPLEMLKASGSHPAEVTLTQEEFTQHMMRVHPVSDLQIRLEGDQFAVSGRVDKERIPAFVRTLGLTGISDAEILETADKYLPANPVFSFSGTGYADDDAIFLTLETAEIGRLPVPTDYASDGLATYLQAVLDYAPGFSAEAASIADGQLQFRGTATDAIPEY